MADERDDKFDGIGPTETGDIATTRDCASNGGKCQTERDGCVCEKCASTWTIEAIERGLTLMSDPISRAFFHDRIDLVEYLIRNVLGDDAIELVDMRQQVVVSNPSGHSAQFDIVAHDVDGKIYNIEFQNRSEKAIVERAYFYASTLLLDAFKKSVEYENCPKVCVIFLIENGKGCNGRLIERITPMDSIGVCESCPFDVRLVNGSLHDESKPGIMMQDLCRRDLRNLRDPKFKERMDELLHQKIGRKAMCEAQEQWEKELIARGYNEGEARGEAKGEAKGRMSEKLSIARLMIDQNLADSVITYTTGLPLACIDAIRAENQMRL